MVAHIDLVSRLAKKSCISVFRRFTAKRGLPRRILSVIEKNLSGTRNYFFKVYEIPRLKCSDKSIATIVAQGDIQWQTIPPRSLDFEQLWEAAVECVKHQLGGVFGLQGLSSELLNNVIFHIEGISQYQPS